MFGFLKNTSRENSSKTLDFSYYSLSLMVFLISFIFLPLPGYAIGPFKSFFFMLGVTVSFVTWFIGGLVDGKLQIVKSNIIRFYGVFLVVALISALLSTSINYSLFGTNFEVGTFFTLVSAGAAMVLSAVHFDSTKSYLNISKALLLSFWVVFIHQILRFIFPVFFSFGILSNANQSLIGNLHSSAIFFGLISIISISMLEFAKPIGNFRKYIITTLVASLLMLALAGYKDVWIAVGLISLVFFTGVINLFGPNNENTNKKISIKSLIVVFVSIVFIFLGSIVTNTVSTKLGYVETEIRPSIVSTKDIFISSIKERALFGVGPGNFSKTWPLYKPQEVNQTVFWDTNFLYGFGVLPTIAVTSGILGALALLAFIVLFLMLIVKNLIGKGLEKEDPISKYIIPSISLYFVYYTLFYVPSVALFYLAFIMFGLAIGKLTQNKIDFIGQTYLNKHIKIGLAIKILVAILGVVLTTFYIRHFVATLYFRSAFIAYNTDGDLSKAEQNLQSAISIAESDVYYRSLVDIYIRRMSDIANGRTNIPQDQTVDAFQNALILAENTARLAIDNDNTDYFNWISLGRVYEAVVPLQVEGAYDSAKAAYNEAIKLNPNSPALQLTLARLDIAAGSLDSARSYIQSSIDLKPDYAEAYYMLSRVDMESGDFESGEKNLNQAATLAPSSFTIQFNYGAYLYSRQSYDGAVYAFERAVIADAANPDARYALSLSYEKVGRKQESLDQMRIAHTLTPSNEQIATALDRLERGLPAIASESPVVDEPQEDQQN
ncbi:tetratricopeptide repeat protein [Candidatus Nomurabacteria bacterium]|nr:tetratricopeptide repeat protein [Candidatus Nomurabacteria bacterium]